MIVAEIHLSRLEPVSIRSGHLHLASIDVRLRHRFELAPDGRLRSGSRGLARSHIRLALRDEILSALALRPVRHRNARLASIARLHTGRVDRAESGPFDFRLVVRPILNELTSLRHDRASPLLLRIFHRLSTSDLQLLLLLLGLLLHLLLDLFRISPASQVRLGHHCSFCCGDPGLRALQCS